MGDRVLVVFTDEQGDVTPAVYMHWQGDRAAELIREAQPILRRHDPSYAAARFCGFCHGRIDGTTGLGLLPPKAPDQPWEDYSDGDAGVYVVNVATGKVDCFGGYGESFELSPDGFSE